MNPQQTNQKTLQSNLNEICRQIDKQKTKNQNVKLLAVTKTQPVEIVNQAIGLGLFRFGENKVQEAKKKFSNKPENIELHLIGHLQKNKVSKAVQIFDVIQTVDSLELAEKIDKYAQLNQCKQRIYCQINIGEDINKHGFNQLSFLKVINNISQLNNIIFEGLMTILPFNVNNIENRKLYNTMYALYEKIQQKHPTCKELSMGMSNDYITAIQSGSTTIRIGTGLFGKR